DTARFHALGLVDRRAGDDASLTQTVIGEQSLDAVDDLLDRVHVLGQFDQHRRLIAHLAGFRFLASGEETLPLFLFPRLDALHEHDHGAPRLALGELANQTDKTGADIPTRDASALVLAQQS